MSQPIIGIVSNREYIEKGIYKKPIHNVNDDYLNMIYRCGGVPIIIPNTNTFDSLKPIVDKFDALLLIGGEDVSSNCYLGEKVRTQEIILKLKYIITSKKIRNQY